MRIEYKFFGYCSKKLARPGAVVLLLSLLTQPIFADASSITWGTKTTAEEDPLNSGLQSGRYQNKNLGSMGDPKLTKIEAEKKMESQVHLVVPRKKIKKAPASLPESTTKSEFSAPQIISQDLPEEPSELAEKNQAPPPSLSEQWADLWHGGRAHTNDLYRARLHPDDNRNNHLELEAASGIINDSSSGNETYRVYSSTSPYAHFGAHFWLTPLIGFSATYQSTLGESINTATSGTA